MNNKDRIAIFLTLIYALALQNLETDFQTVIVFLIPVVLYWCYRAVKNVMSFKGKSDDRA